MSDTNRKDLTTLHNTIAYFIAITATISLTATLIHSKNLKQKLQTVEKSRNSWRNEYYNLHKRMCNTTNPANNGLDFFFST